MDDAHQPYTFISLAYEPWSDIWLNRQHIMSRMARAHRVLHCPRIPWWRELVSRIRCHQPIEWRSRRIAPTLNEIRPAPWLPQVWEWPDLDRFLQKLQAARLRSVLRRAGWDNRILYIWYPEMAGMVGRLGERLVCFHCYDYYLDYPWLRPRERHVLTDRMKRLLDRADLVFAAGGAMATQLGRRDVHIVPNGVDYELFAAAHTLDEPPPVDLAHIPQPIVAHVGRLHAGIDFALLAEIARRRRDWSVVALGPVPGSYPPEQQAAYNAFVREPNAYRIEGKPVIELPRYLRHARVALMAYQHIEWTKQIFPLKLFEYLAAGKPCVGPPIEENIRHSRFVTVATTPEEWVAAIEHWLANDTEELALERMAFARQNSWDARCRRILGLIADKLGDPPPLFGGLPVEPEPHTQGDTGQ
ncbi:MAG: glycosyltransferase [Verrucomicrobia bacterium]|nr:glycosyltransferase [Verrucomicrobiota bacterium]